MRILQTSNGTEYYYITPSYKDPVTDRWKTKNISTGLPVKSNKRKAQALIPDLISKYRYLEKARITDTTVDPDILLCDYIDYWLEGKKPEIKKATYEGYVARSLRIKEYQEKMLFLTKDEVVDLIHFLEKDNPRLVPIAFIAAYYGLRRSELLGLKWNAIDFKKKQITIRHTVVRVSTIDEADSTKTPAGRRTLALFPVAECCLRKLKAEQEENAKFFGNTYQNADGYVFTWEDGRCYDSNYITRFFAKSTKRFGRPEITLHKLRHTCVSLLSEMGWDLKKIQYWCGHKDYNTTANIYMHFNQQRLNGSAEDLALLTQDCADVFR